MSAIALSLILLSAVTHAIVNILTKRADDKYAMRVLLGVFSASFAIPFLFVVPLPHGLAVWCLVGTGAVHIFYEWLLVRSYESTAFSAVYPVARGTGPLFTAVGAIFVLRENAPPLELLGIAFICGGVIAIGLSHRASQGAVKGLGFALATGLTIGCYTVVDATGVRAVENPFTYVSWFYAVHGITLPLSASAIRGRTVMIEARRHWRLGLLLGALSIMTYGSAMLAYRFGATAQLAALRETSVLFGTALAVIVLHEHMNTRRWIAAAGIVAGAILLQAG
ncbi:MAG: EamA family transporter [Rhizomicrobium sp.]